jgi:hypothetical protein
MKISSLKTLILAGSLAIGSSALASTIGVTTSPGAEVFTHGNWILGYSFAANTNIWATGLGLYDHNSDGLNSTHQVGLWDASGTLLASATVNAGTGGTLVTNYRFSSISAVALSAGSTYFVGATAMDGDNDEWLQNPSSLSSAAEITYLARQYTTSSGSLVFPSLSGSGSTGYFGANFLFETGAPGVPDQGSSLLLLLPAIGALAVAASRRRR